MRALQHAAIMTDMQRQFADAILSDEAAIPELLRMATDEANASRFCVHRNNVIAGLMNALAVRFPVVRRLLWDDSFERVARLYVTTEPPCSPVLLQYGDRFPRFLRRIGQGPAAEYLADIAELEAARTRAYHARDARTLDPKSFAAFAPDRFAQLRLQLHPSVSLIESRYPVVTAWCSHQESGDGRIGEWKPEAALIARPDMEVEVRLLSQASHHVLRGLLDGLTVAEAVARAQAAASDFDLAECLTTLFAAGIVVGFQYTDQNAAPARAVAISDT